MLRTKLNQKAAGEVRNSSAVSLLKNEEVQASIGTTEDGIPANGDVILLTDKRIIHISGSEVDRRLAAAAIEDIGIVEITRHSAGGYSAFIWAALAFFVSFVLWRFVIDNQTIAIGAAAIVALMGVYLIFDRLTSRGGHILSFKANGAAIQCQLSEGGDQAGTEALITRLFELKEQRSNPRHAQSFSPR